MRGEGFNGYLVLEWRQATGRTQVEAAHLLGVTPQCLSKWERAETTPRPRHLLILSNVFAIPVASFFQKDFHLQRVA